MARPLQPMVGIELRGEAQMGDIAMTDNLAVLELKTPMTYALDMGRLSGSGSLA